MVPTTVLEPPQVGEIKVVPETDNQRLKQKTDIDFDQLHRDHKHLDAEHKKLITESDRQQEKLRELRDEVNRTSGGLAEEQ